MDVDGGAFSSEETSSGRPSHAMDVVGFKNLDESLPFLSDCMTTISLTTMREAAFFKTISIVRRCWRFCSIRSSRRVCTTAIVVSWTSRGTIGSESSGDREIKGVMNPPHSKNEDRPEARLEKNPIEQKSIRSRRKNVVHFCYLSDR